MPNILQATENKIHTYNIQNMHFFGVTINTCAPLFYILIALLTFLVVVACINFVKPQLVFWGIRNLCRFYILFFGVILFFTIDDVKKVVRFYFVAQIFNVFVGIYKYFVLGLFSDDFGGGIFVTVHSHVP